MNNCIRNCRRQFLFTGREAIQRGLSIVRFYHALLLRDSACSLFDLSDPAPTWTCSHQTPRKRSILQAPCSFLCSLQTLGALAESSPSYVRHEEFPFGWAREWKTGESQQSPFQFAQLWGN